MTGIDTDLAEYRNTNHPHSKVWGLITEFKAGVETQKPQIKNDIYRIDK